MHKAGYQAALIGGCLFDQVGATGTTGFSIWSVFVAFVGATVLLAAIRLASGRRKLLA